MLTLIFTVAAILMLRLQVPGAIQERCSVVPTSCPSGHNLHVWFDQWSSGVLSLLLTFDNPFQNVQGSVRALLVSSLKER